MSSRRSLIRRLIERTTIINHQKKEAIGGYFLLQVKSLEEAVAIAKECPGLAYGAVVEVRRVAEACPIAAEALAEAQLAPANA